VIHIDRNLSREDEICGDASRTSEFMPQRRDANLRFRGYTATERRNFPQADFWVLESTSTSNRLSGN